MLAVRRGKRRFISFDTVYSRAKFAQVASLRLRKCLISGLLHHSVADNGLAKTNVLGVPTNNIVQCQSLFNIMCGEQ